MTDVADLSDNLVENPRIALCLSGGGFRASLFHLGVIRRLHELGILKKIKTISSVSGGSILSGFLAHAMVENEYESLGEIKDWEKQIETPFRDFTSRDLRTWPFLAHILWNWANPQPRSQHLLARYKKRLTDIPLSKIPEEPVFIFCATDMVFGVNFEFRQEKVGDYQIGYAKTNDTPKLTLAHAIAASASFPPIFGPMAIPVEAEKYTGGHYKTRAERIELTKKLQLSDGGVYDNMGLEPIWKHGHDIVIVSDCGAPFRFKESKVPLLRYLRYQSVIMGQVRNLRSRWLMPRIRGIVGPDSESDLRDGVYFKLNQNVKNSNAQGYSNDVVKKISTIRTDLDRFTGAEQGILINHGYTLIDDRIQEELPGLIESDSPLNIPYDSLMDEEETKKALSKSDRRILHWRWFTQDKPNEDTSVM